MVFLCISVHVQSFRGSISLQAEDVPISCKREDVRCNRVWQSPADWQAGREDVVEGGVEGRRVTFIYAVCAQSREAAGGDLGLPTGWTDFLCRVMLRTGLEDKGLGPWGVVSGAGHGMDSELMLFSAISLLLTVASFPVWVKIKCTHLLHMMCLFYKGQYSFLFDVAKISMSILKDLQVLESLFSAPFPPQA